MSSDVANRQKKAGDRTRTGNVQLGRLEAHSVSTNEPTTYNRKSKTPSSRPSSSTRKRADHASAIDPADAEPDAELQAVVEAWPTLPTAVRAGIVATVRAVTGETDREGGRPPER